MAKFIVLSAAAAGGVITALDAQARAAPKRCSRVGVVARAQVPASWDGQGAPPRGWLLPYSVMPELGGARVAIMATDEFAAGKGQFSGALNALPADWKVDDEAGALATPDVGDVGVRSSGSP
jgi:hypothetical protein